MNCRIRNVSGGGEIISPLTCRETLPEEALAFSLRIKDTGCGLKSTRPKTVEIQDIEQGEKEKMLIYHTTYRE